MLVTRRRGEKQAFDQRILGDRDFVQQVVSNLDDFVKKNLRLSGQRIDMEAIAEKAALKYDVSIENLFPAVDEGKWPKPDVLCHGFA